MDFWFMIIHADFEQSIKLILEKEVLWHVKIEQTTP